MHFFNRDERTSEFTDDFATITRGIPKRFDGTNATYDFVDKDAKEYMKVAEDTVEYGKKNYMNIRDSIIQLGLYEALPFFKSLYLKRRYMLLAYESVNHAEKKLFKKIQMINEEKEDELRRTGRAAWGVKDRARWNIDIEGFNVDVLDYVSKGVWDFLHYAHVCIEMIPQILNVSVFPQENKRHKEKVSMGEMCKRVPEKYEKLKEYLASLERDDRYQYIISSDNYIKHIDNIGIKMTFKGFDDFDSFVINEFSYRDNEYEARLVSDATTDLKDFVIKATDDFFECLTKEEGITDNQNGVVMDINYEILKDEKVTKYVAFFVDVEEDSYDSDKIWGGHAIYVHPLNVDKEYNIYEDNEFKFDTLFIRDESSKKILGKAILVKKSEKDYYKKYVIEPCTQDDYSRYIMDFPKNYKRVRINNMLAFSGIERRVKKHD